MKMARYSEKFKGRAVAQFLPPESAPVDVVARAAGIGSGALLRIVRSGKLEMLL